MNESVFKMKSPKRLKSNSYLGTSFVFEDDGHQIVLWRSIWTDQEKVWVDGQLVSKKVPHRSERWHEFQWGLNTYRLETRQEGFWTMHHECILFKNEQLARRRTRMANFNPTTERFLAFLGMFFMISLLTSGLLEHAEFFGSETLGRVLFVVGLHWAWHKVFVDFWWVKDNYNSKPAVGLI
jgi:hypothetical protein